MAMERDRYLKGAVIEAVEAPDITRDALALVGFEPEGLARYMMTSHLVHSGPDHRGARNCFRVTICSRTGYANSLEVS